MVRLLKAEVVVRVPESVCAPVPSKVTVPPLAVKVPELVQLPDKLKTAEEDAVSSPEAPMETAAFISVVGLLAERSKLPSVMVRLPLNVKFPETIASS